MPIHRLLRTKAGGDAGFFSNSVDMCHSRNGRQVGGRGAKTPLNRGMIRRLIIRDSSRFQRTSGEFRQIYQYPDDEPPINPFTVR